MTVGLIAALGWAWADPCGLVPPLDLSGEAHIARQGLERTYVFFRDGVQTIAIRPEFTGSVSEFGMLVPLPSPPEVHKIPDALFQHLAAAVEPPLVSLLSSGVSWEGIGGNPNVGGAYARDKHDVLVLGEEALGMYQLAVLQAGSASSLRRWMDAHGFRYPDGMDDVVAEYVARGWAFVAVKARLGEAEPVQPRPGMRRAQQRWPEGQAFEGAVQGMAFRFEVDEAVVPMRLSTFNGGTARNLVYFLTDAPIGFRELDESLVVQQIPGARLREHLARLELEIFGSGELPPEVWDRLEVARDPTTHSGLARDQIAADLAASASQQLSLGSEVRTKGLLEISERLGVRGPLADALIRQAVASQAPSALQGLDEMTLTVFFGDFPREVLRRMDLTVEPYVAPVAPVSQPEVWRPNQGWRTVWGPRRIDFTYSQGELHGPWGGGGGG